jgi:hypothetical protein
MASNSAPVQAFVSNRPLAVLQWPHLSCCQPQGRIETNLGYEGRSISITIKPRSSSYVSGKWVGRDVKR